MSVLKNMSIGASKGVTVATYIIGMDMFCCPIVCTHYMPITVARKVYR